MAKGGQLSTHLIHFHTSAAHINQAKRGRAKRSGGRASPRSPEISSSSSSSSSSSPPASETGPEAPSGGTPAGQGQGQGQERGEVVVGGGVLCYQPNPGPRKQGLHCTTASWQGPTAQHSTQQHSHKTSSTTQHSQAHLRGPGGWQTRLPLPPPRPPQSLCRSASQSRSHPAAGRGSAAQPGAAGEWQSSALPDGASTRQEAVQ
jgi:hypothetical protein